MPVGRNSDRIDLIASLHPPQEALRLFAYRLRLTQSLSAPHGKSECYWAEINKKSKPKAPRRLPRGFVVIRILELNSAQTASFTCFNPHRHFRRYSILLDDFVIISQAKPQMEVQIAICARTTTKGRAIALPFVVVRATGVEPAHLAIQDPKSCASANFAMPAYDMGMMKFLHTHPCMIWA